MSGSPLLERWDDVGVTTETHGTVAVVTLDRPQALNALDPSSMAELHQALVAIKDDDGIDVGILTGAGTRAFCTGADLSKTPPAEHGFAAGYFGSMEKSVAGGAYVKALTFGNLNIGKPLIAAINGHALGGGLEIALQCDIRIASDNASFGLPEARWASVPGAGGVSNLMRAIPQAIALKMVLTGERIDAAEAWRVGLISDVVAPDELLPKAMEIAGLIVANGPLAVRSIVTFARRSQDLPLSQAVEFEQMMWGLLRDTDDRREGREAFAAKRSPRYRGE